MDHLLPSLLILALLDSLNPSALVVALWLLAQPHARPRLLAYVAGILAAYLGLGIAIMLGATAAHDTLAVVLDHPLAMAAQALLGAGLLAYAIFAPSDAHQAREPRLPGSGGLAAFVLLGMTVTLLELATALPYFAALALMVEARLSHAQWLPLLAGYNLVFVAPPLALLALHVLLGQRTDARFVRWRERLRRGAREATLWIFGIVGVALLGDALSRWFAGERDRDDPVSVHALVPPVLGPGFDIAVVRRGPGPTRVRQSADGEAFTTLLGEADAGVPTTVVAG